MTRELVSCHCSPEQGSTHKLSCRSLGAGGAAAAISKVTAELYRGSCRTEPPLFSGLMQSLWTGSGLILTAVQCRFVQLAVSSNPSITQTCILACLMIRYFS